MSWLRGLAAGRWLREAALPGLFPAHAGGLEESESRHSRVPSGSWVLFGSWVLLGFVRLSCLYHRFPPPAHLFLRSAAPVLYGSVASLVFGWSRSAAEAERPRPSASAYVSMG
jgi:hypothetical protein